MAVKEQDITLCLVGVSQPVVIGADSQLDQIFAFIIAVIRQPVWLAYVVLAGIPAAIVCDQYFPGRAFYIWKIAFQYPFVRI